MHARTTAPSLLLLVVLGLLAPLFSSAATSFAGDFVRTSLSPSSCINPTSCDYLCTTSYTITVAGSVATLFPTANPPGCICFVASALVSGTTATGGSPPAMFTLTLTSDGMSAVYSVGGLTCFGKFSGGTKSTLDTTAPRVVTPSTTTRPPTTSGSTSAPVTSRAPVTSTAPVTSDPSTSNIVDTPVASSTPTPTSGKSAIITLPIAANTPSPTSGAAATGGASLLKTAIAVNAVLAAWHL